MAINNDGHLLDDKGNVAVDFVYGNFPLQPNDVRLSSPSFNATGGGTGDTGWSTTTDKPSGYLTFPDISVSLNNGIVSKVPADNHVRAETAYAGYPSFISAAGNFIVTAGSGVSGVITYTAQNTYKGGESVNITGFTNSAFNLSAATVASANATSFTVSNSGANGLSLTGQNGKVEITTALTGADGAYVAGVPYVSVPNVLGLLAANAADAMLDAELVPTTASGATNTAKSITRINVTSSTTATVYASGADTAYAVGTKVSIGSGTGIPSALVGSWTVTSSASGNIVIYGNGWTVADTGTISPAASLTGTSGTISTQSVAAGASSTAIGAAVTITPWA